MGVLSFYIVSLVVLVVAKLFSETYIHYNLVLYAYLGIFSSSLSLFLDLIWRISYF